MPLQFRAWLRRVARLAFAIAVAASGRAPPALAAEPPPIPHEQLVAASYRQGMLTFQQRCSACHSLAEGGNDLAGPNLHGMFAREAGSKRGFVYSDAMEGAGFRWTPERLLALISDPQRLVPGTTMLLPEPVPEADRIALVSFVMFETGGADWPRPAPPPATSGQHPSAGEGPTGRDADLAARFPSFWNHLMTNTTRYRLQRADGDFGFDAYFRPDGSVGTNVAGMRGFWRVDDNDMFCYALYGMPVPPRQLVECFPVVAMSIPRFREELWTTTLPGGEKLTGGIVAGRPAGERR
jgi:cytochrome c